MTIKELSLKSGLPLWKVYYVANKLGRLPSLDELAGWKPKRGRPPKNWGNNETKNALDDMFGESIELLEKITLRKEN